MYNVLIADDESSVVTGLCSIIDWNALGFHVRGTAKDGEEALSILMEGGYNLVVTDIRMPGMDGLELAEAVHSRRPSVRMLVISGYSDFNYARSAIKYGVNGYLLKPIDREELMQYVAAIKEELDRETGDQEFITYGGTVFERKMYPDIVSRIREYVEQHYAENLNLKTISGVFYMSPVYLGRLYKNATGEAFSDYINKVRIAEVKKKLMLDASKMSDIVKKSGYNSQEYFYRAFRKYEGISFAEYKDLIRGTYSA